MEHRPLGESGLKVPVLGLGTATFGGGDELFRAWGTTDAAEARGLVDRGSSRHHLVSAFEASLRRLRTDHVDLLYVHEFDRTTPVEETMRALDDLVTAGKVRKLRRGQEPPADSRLARFPGGPMTDPERILRIVDVLD